MKKLLNNILIIDGSYMLHKNLKVKSLFDMETKGGIKVGGVFGFMRSLTKALYSTGEVLYPVVCWDAGLSPRRLELLPDYKKNISKQKEYMLDKLADDFADSEDTTLLENLSSDDKEKVRTKVMNLRENQRKFGSKKDKEDYMYQYKTQRACVIEICNALGIPSIRIDGEEGDDLITLLSRASLHSVIVTDDRDLLQLLSPTIQVNRIVNKQYLTYDKYMTENGFKTIREMIIIKAIIGDTSDNIPSVTEKLTDRKFKVGEATAKRIARIIVDNEEDPDKFIPILLEETGKDKNKFIGFTKCLSEYYRNMKLVDLSEVKNDYELMDKIISEIKITIGTTNLVKTYACLGKYEIYNVDVSTLIGRLNQASKVFI